MHHHENDNDLRLNSYKATTILKQKLPGVLLDNYNYNYNINTPIPPLSKLAE